MSVPLHGPLRRLRWRSSEVNSGFFYKSATERQAMVAAERKFIDDRVEKIIALKKKVCEGERSCCCCRWIRSSLGSARSRYHLLD